MRNLLNFRVNSYNFHVVSNCLNRLGFIIARNYASRNENRVFGGDYTFSIKDKKMGRINYQEETVSNSELTKEGLNIMKRSIPMFKEEMKQKVKFDVKLKPEHGDFEYFFQADNKESMDKWVVSTDKDYHQGKSSAKLSVSQSNKALFHGEMHPDIPKDGKTQQLGFCNLRSPLNEISFGREIPYDWTFYTHLLLRVRGDGRSYMVNVHLDRYFDVHWMDLYQYPLYTRGGPYWQFVKIPFSSFFLSAVGKLQDNQTLINLEKVKNLSFTAMDYHGAFQLEIDYIALIHDENDIKPLLYELYEKSPFEYD